MLATDNEILGSLTKTSANDHRKQFITKKMRWNLQENMELDLQE